MKKKQIREFVVWSGDPELQRLNDDIQWLRKAINFLTDKQNKLKNNKAK